MKIDDSAVQAPSTSAHAVRVGGLADGSTGLFDELAESTRSELERRVRELRLPVGTRIFGRGEVADALYLVRSGLVDVTTGADDGPRIDTLGPGDIFGEQALLTGRPRVGTAVAQTGVTLWRLDHTDFLYLIGTDPQLGATVARIVSERLTAANRIEMGASRGQTILLFAKEQRIAADLCTTLTTECAKLLREQPVAIACGPPETWSATDLPVGAVYCDPEDLANAAVRAVRLHGLVLMVCASEVPAVAFAGADDVICVGDPPADLTRRRKRAARILPAAAPDVDEVRALARAVCGRRIGLALGSGGIRGWAHFGVLSVLAEARVPIDFVSGASAGALAGALFLSGMPADAFLQLPAIARDVASASVRSYRPSLQAILSERVFLRYLRDKVGDSARIEDLPIPFIVATTDLDTREPVHLRTGRLAEAVVASAALNGVFPPITIDGRRLVDGGASDPVPVAALRDAGADTVIAVNVMQIGRGASGLYTPRFRIPLPGLLDTLMIGLDTVMSQAAVLSCQTADIVVAPARAGATWRDLLPTAKYAAAGAAAMRAELPKIRQLLGEETDAA
jgi:NTE family protein